MAYCYLIKQSCPTLNLDCADCQVYKNHKANLDPSARFCDCNGCIQERRHYKGFVSLKDSERDYLMRNSQRSY